MKTTRKYQLLFIVSILINLSCSKSEDTSVKVTGITIEPSNVTIEVDESDFLTAKISPSNASDKQVSWKSTNTSVVTVSDQGMINGISEGTATVTCTTADGGKKAECVVNVNTPGDPDVIVSKITLNKTTLTMSVNGTFELDPTLFPSNAYNKTLQWKSSNEDVVTVNDYGDLVAHSTGPSTITVTAVDGGASATCQIIVASENMVPAMTGNTAPEGIVTSSGVPSGTLGMNKEAFRAFDGNDDTFTLMIQVIVLSPPSTYWYLGYEFETPTIINKYQLLPNAGGDSHPKNFRLEGYDDGTHSWIKLNEAKDITTDALQQYAFTNDTAYKKYRLYITSINGGTNAAIKTLKLGYGAN